MLCGPSPHRVHVCFTDVAHAALVPMLTQASSCETGAGNEGADWGGGEDCGDEDGLHPSWRHGTTGGFTRHLLRAALFDTIF